MMQRSRLNRHLGGSCWTRWEWLKTSLKGLSASRAALSGLAPGSRVSGALARGGRPNGQTRKRGTHGGDWDIGRHGREPFYFGAAGLRPADAEARVGLETRTGHFAWLVSARKSMLHTYRPAPLDTSLLTSLQDQVPALDP